MTSRRVAVTGLGVVSPLGNTVAEAWSSAVAGKSGIAPISTFDTTGYAVNFAGQVRDFDAELYMDRKEARRCDEFIQYGIAAGVQAIADAGLTSHPEDAHRFGLAVGSGIGGINNIEKTRSTLEKSGPRRVSPFFVPGSVVNMIGGHLSIMYGYSGPNIAVVTACTTGTHNIGMGARMIRHGDADVMVVGGSEFGTSPTSIAGFANMKALSTRNDAPEAASRPWDKDRDGFVLGDGAGVLVLEEYERAKQRGAPIYAELLGFGMSADAHHITSPREDGAGGIACMENAIADAGPAPGGRGLHQCPRHFDALGRCGRNQDDQACLWRGCPSGGQFHQVHDRALARCGGVGGGDLHHPGAARPNLSPNHQSRRPGRRLRS